MIKNCFQKKNTKKQQEKEPIISSFCSEGAMMMHTTRLRTFSLVPSSYNRKPLRLQTITTSTQHFSCRTLLRDLCANNFAFRSSQKIENDSVANNFSQNPYYFHHLDKRFEQPFFSLLFPFQQRLFIQGKFEKMSSSLASTLIFDFRFLLEC
jgi:hypothetical protein